VLFLLLVTIPMLNSSNACCLISSEDVSKSSVSLVNSDA
jgi:hypothetical protein